MSEVFGRKHLYLYTYAAFVVLSGIIGLVTSIEVIILLRFLGGLAGSFTQAVAPAVIADMFATNERGFVLAFFTLAGLMGQMLGPIFCGFLDAAYGWRSLALFIACLATPTWLAMMYTFPETYAPVLLKQRAVKMEAILGTSHLVDGVGEEKTMLKQLKVGALRPFLLLFLEPIVALLTAFLSVVQGTMFLLFAAYPIVFQQVRGWPQGVASLPFLAVALGIVIALFYAALIDQKRYAKVVEKCNGRAPPEARLPPAMLGSVCLPVGLFWFAWSNDPNTFWLICVSAGVFTGFGMVLLYMSLTNYIVDAYLGYAASALAATVCSRSLPCKRPIITDKENNRPLFAQALLPYSLCSRPPCTPTSVSTGPAPSQASCPSSSCPPCWLFINGATLSGARHDLHKRLRAWPRPCLVENKQVVIKRTSMHAQNF